MRAQAARAEVAAALEEVEGVAGVDGVAEDGTVVVIVRVETAAARSVVAQSLDTYALNWRAEVIR